MAHAIYVVPNDRAAEPERQVRHNLPAQATSLVGRERQIEGASALLARPDVRLVSMTGPPGVGKTRLGLEVAAGLAGDFSGGVYFVALAAASNPAQAVSAIAQTLGLKEAGRRDLRERLKDYIRDRQMLLVLDNLEQVVSAAPLVSDLLKACHLLKILVTSRTLLRVYGEHDFPVQPFDLPVDLRDLESVARNDAVELFVQRARAANPDFRLTQENSGEIAEICARLDGLPLAIELAAARVRLLPPRAMLARIVGIRNAERRTRNYDAQAAESNVPHSPFGRLHLLKDGAQDLPPRQQTLRNAISWSYDLLDEDEQRLLRRLAVFVSGFTLEAAESILDFGRPEGTRILDQSRSETQRTSKIQNALDGVSSLANKSLLQQETTSIGEPRFVMLDTIREYALERLEQSQEAEEVRWRHADFYLGMAEEGDTILQGKVPTSEHSLWIDRLEREHDNLRAALDWSISNAECGTDDGRRTADDVSGPRLSSVVCCPSSAEEMALRFVGALGMFWEMHGHLSEGREWASRALLAVGCSVEGIQPGKATSGISHSAFRIPHVARALLVMGKLSLWQGAFDRSRDEMEASLAIYKELDDRWGMAAALVGLGHGLRAQGDYGAARSLFDRSLQIRRELGYRAGIASSLHGLGAVAFQEGDYARAACLLEEGLSLAREMGHKWAMIHSLNHLGLVRLHRGEHAGAADAIEEALALSFELGDKLSVTRCFIGLAEVACALDRHQRAVRLFGAADALLEAACICIWPDYRAEYERCLAAARSVLDPQTFASLWDEGRRLPPEQVAAPQSGAHLPADDSEEQSQGHRQGTIVSLVGAPAELSARELEVLHLIALGLTNAQIARKLTISAHTVNNHLRSIFGKLGVASRSAATRYAIVNKLV
jgi:predicted ATPase/DNA-binding CsgD family transcriptional regulator